MLKPVHYQIISEKISFPIKIAQLSDLHGATYGNGYSLLLECLHCEKPDIVVMTGDLVDERDASLDPFLSLCQEISKIYTAYYIPGNHEQRFSNLKLERLLSQLKTLGITVLINGSELVLFHGTNFRIYGLVTPMKYYKDLLRNYHPGACLSAADINQLIGNCDSDLFSILLSHNPLYFPSYSQWGADLTLSGHIHGGIIRLPGLGGLLSPEAKFFPKYDGGYFMENGKHLVVSRGLGNNFAIRINNPPELVFVTLKPIGDQIKN